MSVRYLLVGVVFYFMGGRKIRLDSDSIKVAVFATLSTGLWAVGLQYVSPGDSAVLSYTMPLFSIPIAYFAIRERATYRELAGAIIGFSGVVLYSMTLDHGSALIGAILTVLNAVFWAAYSVYYRKLRNTDPMPVLTTQFLLGSLPFLIGALIFPEFHFTQGLFIDLIYIVVFTGLIQYYLWNGLLRRGRIGRITTMAFAVPATSIIIDSILTSSIPSYIAIVGAAIMFFGIFLSSWTEDRGQLKSVKVDASTKNKEASSSGEKS